MFALADRRLAWVADRQSLLAQNIANANTPKWQSHDLMPFSATLAAQSVQLAQTAPGHFAGTVTNGPGVAAVPGERSPDGNSVVLDKELAKMADTDSAHEVATSLMRKYLGLFRTAIGK